MNNKKDELAPFTFFGQTRMVPVLLCGAPPNPAKHPPWDEEMFIEREEDWYALSGTKKCVRVITKQAWDLAEWDNIISNNPWYEMP